MSSREVIWADWPFTGLQTDPITGQVSFSVIKSYAVFDTYRLAVYRSIWISSRRELVNSSVDFVAISSER
jgi:hypothetical protein